MLELQGLQQRYEEIRSLGAEVFFVGPETRDNAQRFMEKGRASIPILYDRDGRVMDAYRIVWEVPPDLRPFYARVGLEEANPETGWKLPVPATYVVGRDRRIHAAYVNADYTYRMEPQEVVEALARLRS